MLASYQKSQILGSLELMNSAQRDKVLQYMKTLLESPETNRRADVRARALLEIQRALRDNSF